MSGLISPAAFALALLVSLAADAAPSTAATREIHVALLGDSLAYGSGDESGKGIAGRLAPELRRRGIDRVVTTNLGASGATTLDVAARLRQADVRAAIARTDAIVLSMGANDLRRSLSGQQSFRVPLEVIDKVLRNMDAAIADIRTINPTARILILGAYVPVRQARAAVLLAPLVAIWDATLVARFAVDPLIELVRLSDIVDRPGRLSTLDSFHPGGEAYQETASRIAELLARLPPPRCGRPRVLTPPDVVTRGFRDGSTAPAAALLQTSKPRMGGRIEIPAHTGCRAGQPSPRWREFRFLPEPARSRSLERAT